jgi:hypothetical protein
VVACFSGRGGRGGRGRGRGRGRGKFTCFNCGKSGHTPSHCPAAKTNEQRLADGRHCDYCGKNGHLEHTCWLKPGNKVPDRAVKGLQEELRELRASSVGQRSSGSSRAETILCALAVGDQEIWYRKQ